MLHAPLQNHTRAVGQDGLPNTTIFNNRVKAIYNVNPQWSYGRFVDAAGELWWRAELIATPSIGPKKAYAKDSAAHSYLVHNQVILPPPLPPY